MNQPGRVGREDFTPTPSIPKAGFPAAILARSSSCQGGLYPKLEPNKNTSL